MWLPPLTRTAGFKASSPPQVVTFGPVLDLQLLTGLAYQRKWGDMVSRRVSVVVLLALLLVVAGSVPAVADRPAPVGDQFNLMFGVPALYQADTPFHDTHGFTFGRGERGAGLYNFELWMDGEYLPADFTWIDNSNVRGRDGYIGKQWVFNFPDGLAAGTYEFTGVWSMQCKAAVALDVYAGPCDSPGEMVPVLEITNSVVFG